MTSNNYITSSFQSAEKLVTLGALLPLGVNALAPQNPTTPPQADASANVIQSPQDLLALIPDTLDTRPGGEWNAAAIRQANDILRGGSRGKPHKLTFTV